jgi:hypothetical protein
MAPLPVALLAALFKENIMAASGFTPILIYASGTATNVPLAANLTSSASGAELALNYADGKLYFKNSSGVVTLLAGAGGAGVVAGSNTQIQFNNSGVFGASANLTWSGTVLSTTGLTATGAITLNTTTNNQSYTTTGAGTITISSGTAGSINNMTIGGTTAAAGTFTNLTYTGTLTGSTGVIAIGTNQIYKDASGNVGIGTASPSQKLDVVNTANSGISIRVNSTNAGSSTYGSLIFGNDADSSVSYIQQNSSTNTTLGGGNSLNVFSKAGAMTFSTASTERMRIDSSGNVGIGATSLVGRLRTTLAADGLITLFNGTTYGLTFTSSSSESGAKLEATDPTGTASFQPLILNGSIQQYKTGGTERMRIDSSGNVGIGTSSPIQKLDVNSNIFARPSTTAGSGELIAAASDYSSLPSFTNTALRQYGSTATGTFYGLTKASLGVLEFVNVSAGLIGTNGGNPIVFATTSTERMRIDSSGNVGIGASSPARKLDVRNTSADYQLHLGDSASTVLGYELGRENTGGLFKFYGNQTGATGYIFSGIDGERMRIDSSGNVLVTNPAGLGYGTGSGGTVTQATSRTTGVTLNKPTGAITLVSAAGSPTWQEFTVTNSIVTANDTFVLNQRAGADRYVLQVRSISAGSFVIAFQTTGGTTTEQPIFNFAIIKGATS